MKQGIWACMLAVALLVFAGTAAMAEETVFELESNPTTGYQWTVAVEGDAVQVAEGEMESDAQEDIAGAPGMQRFMVTGLSEGEATLTFTYARAWEKTAEDQTVVVRATVDDQLAVTLETVSDSRVMQLEGVGTPELTILLEANPTTGFTWQVAQDGDAITLTEQDFQPGESGDAVGVGGIQPYLVEAKQEGEATLTFTYAQAFDAAAQPANQIVLKLSVDAAGNISIVQDAE